MKDAIAEFAAVSFRVLSFSPVQAGRLAALAEVEVFYDGVSFTICGIQVLSDAKGTMITLPKYRDSAGQWRPAIRMPEELHSAMGDAVLEAALEAGVVKRKSA